MHWNPCVIICVHKMIIQDPYSEKQPGPIPARLPYISFKIYRFPPLFNEVLICLWSFNEALTLQQILPVFYIKYLLHIQSPWHCRKELLHISKYQSIVELWHSDHPTKLTPVKIQKHLRHFCFLRFHKFFMTYIFFVRSRVGTLPV